MTYEEFLAQADRLEKQADALRQQAMREKAAAEARKQNETQIQEARNAVIDAVIAYIKLIGIEVDEKDLPELKRICTSCFDELEKAIEDAKKKADMLESIINNIESYEKNNKTPKSAKSSAEIDDEKIRAFLRMLAE